jgi:hypothetical protein
MKAVIVCLVILVSAGARAAIVNRQHQNTNEHGLASAPGSFTIPLKQVWFNDMDRISSITVAVGATDGTPGFPQNLTLSFFDSCDPVGSPPLRQRTETFMVNDLTTEGSWKWVTVSFDPPIEVTYGKYYYFTVETNLAPFKINQNRYNHGRLFHANDELRAALVHPEKKKDLLFRVFGQVDDSKPPYPSPTTNVVCDEKCKFLGPGPERGFPSTGSAVNVLIQERLRTSTEEFSGSFWDDHQVDPQLRMLKTDILEMLEREPGLPQKLGLSETVPFSEIYDTMNFYAVVEDPVLDPGVKRGMHYCANIDVVASVVRRPQNYTGGMGLFAGSVQRPGPRPAPTDNDSCANPITYLPEDVGAPERMAGGFFRDGHTSGFANDFASSCGGGSAPDAIYKFRLREETRVKISTVGSDFDTVLSLRNSGTSCPGSFELACNDDSPLAGGSGSFIDVVLPAGEYAIIVDGAGTRSGRYNLQVSGWGRVARDTLVHEVFGHGVAGLNDEYIQFTAAGATAGQSHLNNPPIGCKRTESGPVVSGWCSDYLRIGALKDAFNATEPMDAQACWSLHSDEAACRANTAHCRWIGHLMTAPGYDYFNDPGPPEVTFRCIPRRIPYHNIGIDCDARAGVATTGCFIGAWDSETDNAYNVSVPGSDMMLGQPLWGAPPPANLIGFSPGVENLIRTLVRCVWPTSCYGYDYDTCEDFIEAWDGHVANNYAFLQFANACERNAMTPIGLGELVTRR